MTLHNIIAQAEVAGDFWQKTYYDNTVSLWLTSLGFVLGSVILGKSIYWVFSKLVKALTQKTKNTLDDLIVDLIEEPIVAAFIASGIYFSLSILQLPTMLEGVIAKSYTMVVTLLVAWLITRFFEAFYQNIVQPWAEKTENDLDDQLLPVLRKGVRSIIWIVAIIIGLNNAGYDVGAMIAHAPSESPVIPELFPLMFELNAPLTTPSLVASTYPSPKELSSKSSL